MLQLLSQEDIKELIPILGHRVKLIAGIKQLKQIIDKAFPTEEQEQNVLNIGDVISTSTNDISLSSILNTHEYCIILSDVPAKEPHTSVRRSVRASPPRARESAGGRADDRKYFHGRSLTVAVNLLTKTPIGRRGEIMNSQSTVNNCDRRRPRRSCRHAYDTKFHFCSDVAIKNLTAIDIRLLIPLLVSGRLDSLILHTQSLRAAHPIKLNEM
ncbi:hypothetical protein EVAR_87108_1 [Eumeta japonica]|uniref:Uncharacterized protein n=1 Tax=Eumeta variegata TaxID=151549 RepID=A0A4C2A2L6_EUMVA|nr:hypothetical protein EVAR_87108_1 [Eumeta japonica]